MNDREVIEALLEPQGSPYPEMLPDPGLYYYYKNLGSRVVWLEAAIDDDMSYIIKMIMDCNFEDAGLPAEERVPIKMFINCDGGELDMMHALCDAIRLSKTPVMCVNIGRAASAACLVFLAGHIRLAMPQSVFLLHEGSGGSGGSYRESKAAQAEWDRLVKQIRERVLEWTSITAEEYDMRMSTDWYIAAKDAVAYHMADRIIESLDEVCI